MRYMMLLRLDQDAVGKEPSDELMAEMGKLLEDMTRQGVLLDTAGLAPVAEATSLRLSAGKTTVVDGPFTEAKEFVGGYCLVQAKDQDEAVQWAQRFLAIHGDQWDLTAEVRQVMEP